MSVVTIWGVWYVLSAIHVLCVYFKVRITFLTSACLLPIFWNYFIRVYWSTDHMLISCESYKGHKCIYEVLPKISENLLIITWILTLSPNFHRHLQSSHLGLVYNDPSNFAIFGSTHWSLPALACLVPVVILLGPFQWGWNVALSTGVSF